MLHRHCCRPRHRWSPFPPSWGLFGMGEESPFFFLSRLAQHRLESLNTRISEEARNGFFAARTILTLDLSSAPRVIPGGMGWVYPVARSCPVDQWRSTALLKPDKTAHTISDETERRVATDRACCKGRRKGLQCNLTGPGVFELRPTHLPEGCAQDQDLVPRYLNTVTCFSPFEIATPSLRSGSQ